VITATSLATCSLQKRCQAFTALQTVEGDQFSRVGRSPNAALVFTMYASFKRTCGGDWKLLAFALLDGFAPAVTAVLERCR
jgi:hypothetical protein